MKRSAAATRRKRQSDLSHLLIVPPEEIYRHMQSVFEPVARRAYQMFESRGRVHGRDLDDWHRAEAEILKPVNVEISDAGNALFVIADVAGYRPEDVRISAQPRLLLICGRSSVDERAWGKSVERPRRLDAFFLSFDLPVSIDASRTSADIKHDLLSIHLPKEFPEVDLM